MADDAQPPPRIDAMDKWVGWSIVVGLAGMVAVWGGFILARVPRQVVLPPWVAPTLIALGLVLAVVSIGGLFVAYRYLRRLIRRQQRPGN